MTIKELLLINCSQINTFYVIKIKHTLVSTTYVYNRLGFRREGTLKERTNLEKPFWAFDPMQKINDEKFCLH